MKTSTKMIKKAKPNVVSKPITLTNIPDARKTRNPNQVLDLNRLDCYEFWDSSRKDTYNKISWIDSIESPITGNNVLNMFEQSDDLKSWFSTLKTVPKDVRSLEKITNYVVNDGIGGIGDL